jgi:hypothetical protein
VIVAGISLNSILLLSCPLTSEEGKNTSSEVVVESCPLGFPVEEISIEATGCWPPNTS